MAPLSFLIQLFECKIARFAAFLAVNHRLAVVVTKFKQKNLSLNFLLVQYKGD